jgi:hypothetical protein
MKTDASMTPRARMASSSTKAMRNRTAATMASMMVSLLNPTAADSPNMAPAAIPPEPRCNSKPVVPAPGWPTSQGNLLR